MSGSPVESPPLAVVLAVVTDFVLATKREAQRTFGTRICVLNAKLLNRRPSGSRRFPGRGGTTLGFGCSSPDRKSQSCHPHFGKAQV